MNTCTGKGCDPRSRHERYKAAAGNNGMVVQANPLHQLPLPKMLLSHGYGISFSKLQVNSQDPAIYWGSHLGL